MKETLGFGVVGAGAIGIRAALTHLSRADVQDRVRLAAVCDPVPGRAQAAAEKYAVPASYQTYEELLADPKVDVVTLCSPIGLHFEQGMQALAAGKHIHFNKTMTITTAEADQLIALAAEKDLRIVAAPGMMLFPHNQRARRLVLEGALGRLAWAISGTSGVGDYHMKEEFRTGQDILSDVNPAWYFQKPGGGPQYDVTVYCLHILTGIVGPARRVTAFSGRVIPERDYHGEKIACEMDDNTHLLLDFGDAFFGVVYASPKGGLTEGFNPNLYGTAGAIVGTKYADRDLKQPDDFPPHVNAEHAKLP
ncbi:MAG: Gfo/Idh/MocA family oxidoreductase, partial [Anaerolineaceae bacterium]|nr:Gfo/Idh/MocA family oxidoreductase [Anaerolineaceae bacterium]